MIDEIMNSLELLIKNKAYSKDPPILKLFNKENIPVAAIYLDKLKADIEDVVICETTTSEKYYIYLNGIAIFFTYYSLEKN